MNKNSTDVNLIETLKINAETQKQNFFTAGFIIGLIVGLIIGRLL